MILRQTAPTNFISNAKASKELHRACIRGVAARVRRLVEALFYQHARRAARSEVHRKGGANRPATGKHTILGVFSNIPGNAFANFVIDRFTENGYLYRNGLYGEDILVTNEGKAWWINFLRDLSFRTNNNQITKPSNREVVMT